MCGQTAAFALARDGDAQRARHRPRGPRSRGPVGHLCAHGYAALAQAPDRARPRLPRAHVPRLVRGPAWERRAGSASPRSPPPIGWPTSVGARHRADRGRERRPSDAIELEPGLRSRAAGRAARRRDRVRAQGRARRRARWRRRPLCAAVSLAGEHPAQCAGAHLPLLRQHRLCPFQGRQRRRARRQRVGLRQRGRGPRGRCTRRAPVLAPAASAAGQQVEVDGLSRVLSRLCRPRGCATLADLHLHLRRGRAAAARVGAALRAPRRLRHPLRRALDRCGAHSSTASSS